MNYRHEFHAGNFADLMKHAVLVCLLEALSRKPGPWCYYDSHAGAGRYNLASAASRRSGEADAGLVRLWQRRAEAPPLLSRLCELVVACQPGPTVDGIPRYYPGSPLLARALARPEDRLVLAEQQPEVAASLKALFRQDAQVGVHLRDGYEMLRALVPPAERRGLALMDPPFEHVDEFKLLAEAVCAAQTRWPGGVYALWYPLKDPAVVTRFHRRLQQESPRPVLVAELTLAPVQSATLAGCGMAIVNPPWQSEAAIAEALAFLARILVEARGRSGLRWLRD